MFENVTHQVIGVVVGIGIIETLAEAVDEDAWIRCFYMDVWVRTVVVVDGQVYVSFFVAQK